MAASSKTARGTGKRAAPGAAKGAFQGATHRVENQPPPLADYNVFETDRALVEALAREGADFGRKEGLKRARALGARVGSVEVQDWARLANRHAPELLTHDRYGNRLDRIEYHPAWHYLMALGVGHAVHALPWREKQRGAHAVKAALAFLMNQGENGVCCPMAMTFAAVPALANEPALAEEWTPRILSTEYDARFIPARDKLGAVFGMAMTEKQGGSDVRANSTRARPAAGEGEGIFLLTGHKWFCSAPMSDAFLTLAQGPGGLTCFLVPRFRPDGTQNRFFLQRLKDKLGNRSNASAEIEYDDTWARRVGPEGRGVHTIIQMVHHTRLDASVSAAAVMRAAVVQAMHHTRHRAAFGAMLADHALMQNVLADLALESEAATAMVMRLARGYEPMVRLATAIAKFWVCKRAPTVVAEAMECLGGGGYIEDGPMPRLYREAPVNGIWEGTGNVICLDILRTIARAPDALAAFAGELKAAAGGDRRLDTYVGEIEKAQKSNALDESQARVIVERLALAWQAALLVQHAPHPVADAFCASRLTGTGGRTLGTLSAGMDVQAIIARAWSE